MEKVLLVIKNYSTLRTFSSFLNEDYKVEAYDNEEDIMKALKKNNYFFILIDLSPSKINGDSIFNFLIKNKMMQNQPVAAILESSNVQKELDLYGIGCSEIFIQPFDSLITRKRLQNVLAMHTLKKHAEVYEKKLMTDPLTGLLNKDGFQTNVRRRLKSKKQAAFLMCDLDGLKYINDNYSHQLGDEIIQGVGKTLKEVMPDDAYVAHISGDEFCVFIKSAKTQEQIAEICTKFQKTLVTKVLIPDLSRPVTCSIGIAMYPEVANNFENLQFKADHALLYVKNHGKNGFKFHTPRDDREELLKGRQECTNIPTSLMLKERVGEEIQTWLKFGEFRIVYIAYKKHTANKLDAHLCCLNITDRENPNNPDCNNVNVLNEKISTHIKDAQFGGIFSWFSINQLLILSVSKETLPVGIETLKKKLSKDLDQLHLDIELSIS